MLMFSVATFCRYAFKMEVLDEFNDAGTMGAFGFLGAYTLIVLAAPVFLKKRGELPARHIVLCAAGMVLLVIPAVGSVYPVPAPPVNSFPYIFVGYLIFGYARILAMQHQKPQRVEEIGVEIQKLHAEAA